MRSIGVVTTSRADYGILRPVLERIVADDELELRLVVSGPHLEDRFGATHRDIERDGFDIAARVPLPLDSDSPAAIAAATGAAVAGYGRAFADLAPDLLVVIGDRFEMHAAAVAALPFLLPVAHLHGGELTEGAFDDALRHSITKLSHLHLVSTADHARRVLQLGEEPWRVTVSGAPALDGLLAAPPLPPAAVAARLGIDPGSPPVMVTFHAPTLEPTELEHQVGELLAALRGLDRPVVFTGTNADPGGRLIRERIASFVAEEAGTVAVEHLGTEVYVGLMAWAAVMVGNSSSGIIEAPSLGLPVVNVGTRQDGRTRAENVRDVPNNRDAIRAEVLDALRPERRAALAGRANPYGDGRAAAVIVDRVREVEIDDVLLRKRFVDRP
ncbi:MAG: UDP-N-acetyl-D-glucosamine 2-epimerase, UDP-hydrolyzing [Actinomycetia bacterium]|nr:UDP-N-acetyl-D-glucosamine 2-epimerase, UDP-hydrolyzing [Actinomycetes bacterium]